LLLAGVEGRINVDELDRFVRERFKDGEIVGVVDAIHGEQ
jgi:hypothetical protein